MVKLSRDLFLENPDLVVPHGYTREDLFQNVCATLQWNGYWAHPENILLSMVHDKRDAVQQKGLQLIQKCRDNCESNTEEDEVRRFEVPQNINFLAKSYEELIDFDSVGVEFTSPPLLKDLSLDDISGHNFKESFDNIPCHSQMVERHVAFTSRSATSAIGQENRHGWMLNFAKSIKKISSHSSLSLKNQYVETAKRKLFDEENEEKSNKK